MKKRVAWLIVLIVGLAVLFVSVATAHEGREVGDYTIEIGWRIEPAYTGLMNGPEITITRHGSEDNHDEADTTPEVEHTNEAGEAHDDENNGVTGLEDTLQIEVLFGPASRVLNLRAVRGEPGHYTADLIPMRPGDYTFRVFGTIEGMEIDETFSAADGQFSSVEPIEDIQFP
ncbi:MAG: hypothetical protein J0M33_02795 [Anaerolineae bacterium]|nr:hypothetical protein [Anaerolineae bacterium]